MGTDLLIRGGVGDNTVGQIQKLFNLFLGEIKRINQMSHTNLLSKFLAKN